MCELYHVLIVSFVNYRLTRNLNKELSKILFQLKTWDDSFLQADDFFATAHYFSNLEFSWSFDVDVLFSDASVQAPGELVARVDRGDVLEEANRDNHWVSMSFESKRQKQ